MLKKIKQHKWCIFFLFVFFLILVFCHFQTFIMNDDLPYSLFFRENNRVTNLKQIISNQLFDYSRISPRIFIHMIVQFLLIFNKTLWSILNPLVIIGIIIAMTYFIKLITKTNLKTIYLLIGSATSFLLLYYYKHLVYWVAGSVNYVWVFLVLILLAIYYWKYGLLTHPIISFFLFTIGSFLCEVTSIFVMIIIITDFILQCTLKKIEKKQFLWYGLFLLGSIMGCLFIFLSPSTLGRTVGPEDTWANLSIISKLLTSIPIISKKLFNVFNFYNLYPLFLTISILYYFRDYKKISVPFFIIILIGNILGIYFSWMYFLLGLCFLLAQLTIFIKQKDYKLIPILICIYAISYSMAITPDYAAGRPNMHFELFTSIFIFYNFLIQGNEKSILKYGVCILFVITIVIELMIYCYIGSVKKERDEALRKVQNGETNVLEVKIIKSPFDKFHIDANSPIDKNYWAYKAFEDYYKLPNDIVIKPVS